MLGEARDQAARMWCATCQRVSEVLGAGRQRCGECGGSLQLDRRRAGERRRGGRLHRVWDPEPRSGTERRRLAS